MLELFRFHRLHRLLDGILAELFRIQRLIPYAVILAGQVLSQPVQEQVALVGGLIDAGLLLQRRGSVEPGGHSRDQLLPVPDLQPFPVRGLLLQQLAAHRSPTSQCILCKRE